MIDAYPSRCIPRSKSARFEVVRSVYAAAILLRYERLSSEEAQTVMSVADAACVLGWKILAAFCEEQTSNKSPGFYER